MQSVSKVESQKKVQLKPSQNLEEMFKVKKVKSFQIHFLVTLVPAGRWGLKAWIIGPICMIQS